MRCQNALRRRALLSGLIVVTGCAQGLPRRVAGSDLTLPEPAERVALRSFLSRCTLTADSVGTSRAPGTPCGGASGDTTRSTSDPLVPPAQKTP